MKKYTVEHYTDVSQPHRTQPLRVGAAARPVPHWPQANITCLASWIRSGHMGMANFTAAHQA